MCHESEVSVGMPTSLVGSAAWDRGYKTPKRKICTINRQLNVLHASAGVPSNPVKSGKNQNQHKTPKTPKVIVVGSRKIWGTRRSTTTSEIIM